MKIIVAEKSGFCYGVKKAVATGKRHPGLVRPCRACPVSGPPVFGQVHEVPHFLQTSSAKYSHEDQPDYRPSPAEYGRPGEDAARQCPDWP